MFSSSKVFFKQTYTGGNGVNYRRGRITEVLEDGTLVVQPVVAFRSPSATDYYTTVDFKPDCVRFEDPTPVRRD
jgi:hypothetical protein